MGDETRGEARRLHYRTQMASKLRRAALPFVLFVIGIFIGVLLGAYASISYVTLRHFEGNEVGRVSDPTGIYDALRTPR